MGARSLRKLTQRETTYPKFEKLDGSHPFQEATFGSYVPYRVRTRTKGKVIYFNFELAKKMGLIPKNHSSKLTAQLEKTLLETFAIQIVNEHDLLSGKAFKESDLKDKHYMATRYLQLQHPSKTGLTSGDGRSIWNGSISHRGTTWDVSSCGTGATCLSPATAINQKFYRTGDPEVSYGCGFSTASEGITDVVLSETLTANGISTERVLCVIEFPNKMGITVRAAPNLIRPSHFFNHLKQGQHLRLQELLNYYIDRQVQNGDWSIPQRKNPYKFFLESMTTTFAQIAAKFEAHYIFCWLDWDGDNILADGGIIDFGSVRQFGLFYHKYRFDDHPRWSTNILEQRGKARYTVQTFAQMIDFVMTGKKKAISEFANSPSLKQFDRKFEDFLKEEFLSNVGFEKATAESLIKTDRKSIEGLMKSARYFEKLCSHEGVQEVADGVNSLMLCNLRRLLRSLPRALILGQMELPIASFKEILSSEQGSLEGLPNHSTFNGHCRQFLGLYLKLIRSTAKQSNKDELTILKQLNKRASIINSGMRLTGDGVCLITEKILSKHSSMTFDQRLSLIAQLLDTQNFNPDFKRSAEELEQLKPFAQKKLDQCLKIIDSLKEGL